MSRAQAPPPAPPQKRPDAEENPELPHKQRGARRSFPVRRPDCSGRPNVPSLQIASKDRLSKAVPRVFRPGPSRAGGQEAAQRRGCGLLCARPHAHTGMFLSLCPPVELALRPDDASGAKMDSQLPPVSGGGARDGFCSTKGNAELQAVLQSLGPHPAGPVKLPSSWEPDSRCERPHPQDTPRRPTEGTCGFRAGERKALHASAREGSAASEEPGTLHARRAALLRTAAPPPCSPRQRGPGRGPVRKGPGAPSRSEEKLPPGADQRQRLPRGLRCRRCSPRPGRCSL